jgi:RNA polymerase sigma-70 factor (ECF subfamily)
MNEQQLLPHLFRTEYRKIVSVIARRFGFDHLEDAQDIASDTFLTASQSWGLNGIPENPTAWLYNVAKNKAKNYLQRVNVFEEKVVPTIKEVNADGNAEVLDLSPQNINDSQLQMMFAVCHPIIPPDAQVGLSLRVLCGFGIEEIADAFLTNKETINKRLFRAREKLREEKIRIELPPSADIETRLDTVLTTIYLLFNEGYYSISQDRTVRKELCLEAMRLCTLLVENNVTNKPQVNALLSLMCFHASRFDARVDMHGQLILYDDQDVNLWNTDLISKGGYFLNAAARGNKVSKYHLEAGIAYWNTRKEDTHEKWENILQLYNRLLQMEYSPVAALNRTYALSKANGRDEAIIEAEKLDLSDNHFYFLLLGELYGKLDQTKARINFEKAHSLAKTQSEKNAIQKKMNEL